MKLWTIQSEKVLETLDKYGEIRTDWRRICFKDFKAAYKKIVELMPVKPPRNRPPIWAWPFKPDMRHSARAPRGDKIVRITFEYPESEALITNFIDWHLWLAGDYSVKITRKRADENCQVTIPELRSSQIQKIEYFTAR